MSSKNDEGAETVVRYALTDEGKAALCRSARARRAARTRKKTGCASKPETSSVARKGAPPATSEPSPCELPDPEPCPCGFSDDPAHVLVEHAPEKLVSGRTRIERARRVGRRRAGLTLDGSEPIETDAEPIEAKAPACIDCARLGTAALDASRAFALFLAPMVREYPKLSYSDVQRWLEESKPYAGKLSRARAALTEHQYRAGHVL